MKPFFLELLNIENENNKYNLELNPHILTFICHLNFDKVCSVAHYKSRRVEINKDSRDIYGPREAPIPPKKSEYSLTTENLAFLR